MFSAILAGDSALGAELGDSAASPPGSAGDPGGAAPPAIGIHGTAACIPLTATDTDAHGRLTLLAESGRRAPTHAVVEATYHRITEPVIGG